MVLGLGLPYPNPVIVWYGITTYIIEEIRDVVAVARTLYHVFACSLASCVAQAVRVLLSLECHSPARDSGIGLGRAL